MTAVAHPSAETTSSGVPIAAEPLFEAHLATLRARYGTAMKSHGVDTLIIDAGGPGTWYLDDIHSDWRTNPHFRLFSPCAPAEGCALVLQEDATPILVHLCPDDYWHLPPQAPAGAWAAHFDIRSVADASQRDALLNTLARGRTARIGPDAVAPEALLAQVDYERAAKTPYELACMRAASARAATGHMAARRAFEAGGSEYEIQLAYLEATAHEDAELPYRNIVALDTHGAVLHYQFKDRVAPVGGGRSFLIDAGADVAGYAADVTRTHVRSDADPGGRFADLIAAMDALQQALVAEIRPGLAWVDLQRSCHLRLARVLSDAGIARGDPEMLVARGVSHAFLPHGLGHLLGVQTHDAGGQLASPAGDLMPPPAEFPALRLTRTLAPDWVVTVEPGLYFIPMLLDELRAGADAALIDWDLVAELAPFGGIRIEDNVRVTVAADGATAGPPEAGPPEAGPPEAGPPEAGRPENMTRDAFAACV